MLCDVVIKMRKEMERKSKRKKKKKREDKRKKSKIRKESKEHLICNLSTLIFDHTEDEGQEMPRISYTGLLTLLLQGPFTAVWVS